jgi:hypothetical protein
LFSDSVGSSRSGSRRKLRKNVRFDLGPDILSFHGSYLPDDVHMTNYVDVPDDLLPMHSLNISSMNTNGKFGLEGNLPPPPANGTGQMHPPLTLTPRQLALQSSMTTLSLMSGLDKLNSMAGPQPNAEWRVLFWRRISILEGH